MVIACHDIKCQSMSSIECGQYKIVPIIYSISCVFLMKTMKTCTARPFTAFLFSQLLWMPQSNIEHWTINSKTKTKTHKIHLTIVININSNNNSDTECTQHIQSNVLLFRSISSDFIRTNLYIGANLWTTSNYQHV